MNLKNGLRSLIGFLDKALNYLRTHKWIQIFVNGILLIFLVLFIYNYLGKDWSTIRQLDLKLDIKLLVISVLLYGINYYLFLICWHLLVNLYVKGASLRQNSYIYSISQVGKLLPTPLWFISGRLVMYQQDGYSKKTIFTATIFENLLHFLVGGVILILLQIDLKNPVTWLALLSIVPLILVYRFPSIINLKFLGIEEGNFRSRTIGIVLALFMVTWIIAIPYFDTIIKSIDANAQIPMVDSWQIWIISSLVSYIAMFTLGGLGLLREFSLTLLLGPYVSPPVALVIAALSRMIIVIGNLIFPLIVVVFINLRRKHRRIST